MNASEWVFTALVGAAIVIGVAGTIVPILPGLLLVWASLLAYGVIMGFGTIGWVAVIVATALLILGFYLNVRIPQKSAAGSGLTVKAQLVAVALAVIGLFVIPPFGAPVGFVLGVFLMRLRSTGDKAQAWTSTKVTVVALLKASAAQVACAIGMFAVWLVWVGVLALA